MPKREEKPAKADAKTPRKLKLAKRTIKDLSNMPEGVKGGAATCWCSRSR